MSEKYQVYKTAAIIKTLQVFHKQNRKPLQYTGLMLIMQVGDLITGSKNQYIKVIQLADYQHIRRSDVFNNFTTLIRYDYLTKSGPEYTLTVKGWQTYNELIRLYTRYYNIYQANIYKYFTPAAKRPGRPAGSKSRRKK